MRVREEWGGPAVWGWEGEEKERGAGSRASWRGGRGEGNRRKGGEWVEARKDAVASLQTSYVHPGTLTVVVTCRKFVKPAETQ